MPQNSSSNDVLPVLQSKAERQRFYNKIARVYDLLSERSEQPVRQRALEMLEVRPGERILEIGCGTGHCLLEIARAAGPDGKVFGLDIAENMLAQTRRLLEHHGLVDRVELQLGDAEQLPWPDGSMDGVFMSFTLELFDNPEIPRVLAECHRVLRPAGRIVVAALSKEGKPGLVVRAFEWTHAHFPNLMDCRPIHVRQAVEQAGFQIDQACPMQMWVPVEIVRAVRPA